MAVPEIDEETWKAVLQVPPQMVRTMARRRGKKGRGRKGRGAIPLIQTAIVAYPLLAAYHQVGFTSELPEKAVFNLTGFSPQQGKMLEPQRAIGIAIGLVGAQLIGSKIASRTGANRLMKKLSGGYLKIA